MQIRPMTIKDYDEVYSMWRITSARALSSADSRENIKKYLERNAEMSQVALVEGKIVGTVLAGHDGRRGFIHHMAVHPDYRRHHIGRQLATEAINRICADGIEKVHIFSYSDNVTGQDFWKSLGFKKRDDIYVYSKPKEEI